MTSRWCISVLVALAAACSFDVNGVRPDVPGAPDGAPGAIDAHAVPGTDAPTMSVIDAPPTNPPIDATPTCPSCPPNEGCTGGTCSCEGGASCGVGRTCCPGSGCVDTNWDSDNCNMCGLSCGAGGSCVFGTCTAGGGCSGGCSGGPPGTVSDCCGASCANLCSDQANCGSCGHVCPGGAFDFCVLGACTSGGSSLMGCF